jgi:hypothetical protein
MSAGNFLTVTPYRIRSTWHPASLGWVPRKWWHPLSLLTPLKASVGLVLDETTGGAYPPPPMRLPECTALIASSSGVALISAQRHAVETGCVPRGIRGCIAQPTELAVAAVPLKKDQKFPRKIAPTMESTRPAESNTCGRDLSLQ